MTRPPASAEPEATAVFTMELSGHDIRRVTSDDLATIQALFELDPAYFLMNEGAPPRPTEAHDQFDDLPPELLPESQHVLVIDDARTGVISVVNGYPDATTWFLGLIFLAPAARGHGLGARLLDALADHVRAVGGTALRLVVSLANPRARRLYDRCGFLPIMRSSRTTWNGTHVEIDVLERDVTA